MKLFTAARDSSGILFAEDFDDLDAPLERPPSIEVAPVEEEPAPPPEERFSAAELEQTRQAAHEAGYGEGFAAAAEAATATRVSLLAAMTEQLAASRSTSEAMIRRQLDDVTQAVLAVVGACLPVLCEHAGTHDLVAMLRDVLPGLVSEPELLVTVHPDQLATVEEEFVAILGKNTPLQVQTSPSMGRGDVEIAWRSGTARRDTRALRREVTQTLRRSLRAQAGTSKNEEHRHGS